MSEEYRHSCPVHVSALCRGVCLFLARERSQPILTTSFVRSAHRGLANAAALHVPDRVGLASEAALNEVDLTYCPIAVLFRALLSIQA